MGAHMLGLNFENRKPDPETYDHYFRYLLAASVIAGWITGLFAEMSDVTYALWFAYIAGGIVSAGVATELQRVRSHTAFVTFSIGAGVFCVLILLIEAISN